MLPKERSIDFYPRLMSAALNVLQLENEDILNFLAAGTWLSYNCLDDQKKINIYTVNLKSTWEKHLLAAWDITDIGSQADISVVYSWKTAIMLYWCWLNGSLLETSLTKSR